MMARSPSPVRQTGLGPTRNTSLLGGLIPPKLTPVQAVGGPRTPRATPMPNMGPSYRQRYRSDPIPKSRTGGPRRVSLPSKLRQRKG